MDDSTSLGRYLASAEYILALVGAGLSAPSGIPTYRDSHHSLWKDFKPSSFAHPSAFAANPGLVWRFYEDFRRTAVLARPNAGHVALARLAKEKENILAVTQNIDELSERAGHDPAKLAALHGSLFAVKCSNEGCSFVTRNTELQPIAPIAMDSHGPPLPRCTACDSGLLRPGVVWFGERLDRDSLTRTDDWFDSVPRVDLMLVVGTSLRVFPAAEYVRRARERGAYVAHFNLERDEEFWEPGDWFVPGDAAVTLPGFVDEALGISRAP